VAKLNYFAIKNQPIDQKYYFLGYYSTLRPKNYIDFFRKKEPLIGHKVKFF
jgi:hypothetical protein